jgi:hypothetical protein
MAGFAGIVGIDGVLGIAGLAGTAGAVGVVGIAGTSGAAMTTIGASTRAKHSDFSRALINTSPKLLGEASIHMPASTFLVVIVSFAK